MECRSCRLGHSVLLAVQPRLYNGSFSMIIGIRRCTTHLRNTAVEFVRFIGGSGVVVFVVITGSVPLDAVIALTVSGVTGLAVILVDPGSTTLGTVTGLTSCTVDFL